MEIMRGDEMIFQGDTRSAQMKRSLEELVDFLTIELAFPNGVFLMTGTGIVPADDFSLQPADSVRIRIGSRTLINPVQG
jgi:2-dehydro-3-deoxy-D-arabinonate dehydratase